MRNPDWIGAALFVGAIAKCAYGPDDEATANAALIVRAVNQHDTLLGLVRDMYVQLGVALAEEEVNSSSIMARARAVLYPEAQPS